MAQYSEILSLYILVIRFWAVVIQKAHMYLPTHKETPSIAQIKNGRLGHCPRRSISPRREIAFGRGSYVDVMLCRNGFADKVFCP